MTKVYLWQEGLVCEEAVRSQKYIAQLERRPHGPHIDDQIGKAFPELEALEDGGEDWAIPADEYLQKACCPSLVLGQAGWSTSRSTAQECWWVGGHRRGFPTRCVDALTGQNVFCH